MVMDREFLTREIADIDLEIKNVAARLNELRQIRQLKQDLLNKLGGVTDQGNPAPHD